MKDKNCGSLNDLVQGSPPPRSHTLRVNIAKVISHALPQLFVDSIPPSIAPFDQSHQKVPNRVSPEKLAKLTHQPTFLKDILTHQLQMGCLKMFIGLFQGALFLLQRLLIFRTPLIELNEPSQDAVFASDVQLSVDPSAIMKTISKSGQSIIDRQLTSELFGDLRRNLERYSRRIQ